MVYSMTDVVNLLIFVEKKIIVLYESILQNKDISSKLLTVTSVLINEENRHIQNYEEMKLTLVQDEAYQIEMEIYNKLANIVFEFSKMLTDVSAKTLPELLEYAITLENINIGLLKQVLDVFADKKPERHKRNSEFIQNLIVQEEKHIYNLKLFA